MMFDGLRFEECQPHKKEIDFLHIQWKRLQFALGSSHSSGLWEFWYSGKLWEQHSGIKMYSPYCRQRAETGHSPILQLFFSQILLQAFDCISLSALLSALATSCPESTSDLPAFFYVCPPASFSPFASSTSFHAALLVFANCCWCLIRQHFYKKYNLSAAVPLQGHFTKDTFFYVHTVNG